MKNHLKSLSSNTLNYIPLSLLLFSLIIALTSWLSAKLFPIFLPYDTQRIIELAFLIFLALWLLVNTSNRKHWLIVFISLPLYIQVFFFSIFSLGAWSSLIAPRPDMALLELSLYTLLFIFTIFIASEHFILKKSINTGLFFIIYLSCVTYIISFFIIYFADLAHGIRFSFQLPGFLNLRFFAQYQIWTIWLISLPLFKLNPKKILWWLCYLIAAIWWSFTFIDASKGYFLFLIITIILLTLINQRSLKQWLVIQLLAFLGGLIVYGLIYYGVSTTIAGNSITVANNTTPIYGSVYQRLVLWKAALMLIAKHPLLGAGPLHFSYAVPNNNAAHPHNSLLLVASEWGLPATFLIVWIATRGLKKWFDHFIRETNPLNLALTSTLILGILYSLISGVLVTSLSQLLLCFIIGWSLGKSIEIKTTSIGHMQHAMLIILIVLCVFLMMTIVIPTLPNLTQNELNWIITQRQTVDPDMNFSPRFWLQGWIQ